jgi:hypothetical protein
LARCPCCSTEVARVAAVGWPHGGCRARARGDPGSGPRSAPVVARLDWAPEPTGRSSGERPAGAAVTAQMPAGEQVTVGGGTFPAATLTDAQGAMATAVSPAFAMPTASIPPPPRGLCLPECRPRPRSVESRRAARFCVAFCGNGRDFGCCDVVCLAMLFDPVFLLTLPRPIAAPAQPLARLCVEPTRRMGRGGPACAGESPAVWPRGRGRLGGQNGGGMEGITTDKASQCEPSARRRGRCGPATGGLPCVSIRRRPSLCAHAARVGTGSSGAATARRSLRPRRRLPAKSSRDRRAASPSGMVPMERLTCFRVTPRRLCRDAPAPSPRRSRRPLRLCRARCRERPASVQRRSRPVCAQRPLRLCRARCRDTTDDASRVHHAATRRRPRRRAPPVEPTPAASAPVGCWPLVGLPPSKTAALGCRPGDTAEDADSRVDRARPRGDVPSACARPLVHGRPAQGAGRAARCTPTVVAKTHRVSRRVPEPLSTGE